MLNALIKILIVDDHPTMIEGYKSILNSKYSYEKLLITIAYNCEKANEYITKTNQAFDIVFLDLALPPYESAKLFSGEDLAVLIRKLWRDTKIMMITSHTEAFILYNLIKKINPEALLVKSDFQSNELIEAFESVVSGQTYYTLTAKQSLKEVGMNNFGLDSYDRRIISLLAKGIKTKSLPEHIGITISAIDKRKAQIKLFFNIQKGSDEDIIREARKRGLV
ncbi:response regulator [Flavobacterium sp.]|uniref:response regulator transcription factor n=1 Tax=Flavobacterium sp. TaxID=239 RepID=UPI0026092550|nr:response regulator [Flavobacterium sp.]